MTRNQLRLARSDFRKVGFKDLGNAGVQPTSALADKSAVGCILHQAMLEQVSRMRRYALPKQQPGPYQTVKSRLQRSFLLCAPPQPTGHERILAQSPLRSARPPWKNQADQASP